MVLQSGQKLSNLIKLCLIRQNKRMGWPPDQINVASQISEGAKTIGWQKNKKVTPLFKNVFGTQINKFKSLLLQVGLFGESSLPKVLELKNNRAWVGQNSPTLFQKILDFRGGSIFIIRDSFDDQANTGRTESFVGNVFPGFAGFSTTSLAYGPKDILFGHINAAGLINLKAKFKISSRIRTISSG